MFYGVCYQFQIEDLYKVNGLPAKTVDSIIRVSSSFYFIFVVLIFVSPELSSVRDYVITHSVRSM